MSPTLTVVIPYYNEARWIGATLECLLSQTDPPEELVLVDNGSTDGSEGVCRRVLAADPSLAIRHVREPEPGKINALERAGSMIGTDLVSFWDADTWYPAHYLGRCRELAGACGEEVAAFMAIDIYGPPGDLHWTVRRHGYRLISRVLRRQCFTGGYGQTFRSAALRRAGGFSAARWPYVLLDHEIMHRVHKVGASRYDPDLWCRPSARRTDRRRVRWTLGERLLYLLLPHGAKDWFFYAFLARRFQRRGLGHLRLRDKPWQGPSR